MEYKYEKKEDTVWIFLPFYKDWWLYLYPVPTITTPHPISMNTASSRTSNHGQMKHRSHL